MAEDSCVLSCTLLVEANPLYRRPRLPAEWLAMASQLSALRVVLDSYDAPKNGE